MTDPIYRDPAVIGGAGTIIGALLAYLGVRRQKEPDMQTAASAAVTVALEAQSKTISRLEAKVDEMAGIIAHLEEHIDALETAMSQAGISPPPRKPRPHREAA